MKTITYEIFRAASWAELYWTASADYVIAVFPV